MTEPVQDVFCMGIPAEIPVAFFLDHADEEVRRAFFERLTQEAQKTVWDQWPRRRPVRVDWQRVEWLVTDRLEDVAAFQPAHDCADCWMGNLQAEEFLKNNPGRWIAMGNLTYTPIWRSA